MSPISFIYKVIAGIVGWILEFVFTVWFLIPNLRNNIRWIGYVIDGEAFGPEGVKVLWESQPRLLGLAARWEATLVFVWYKMRYRELRRKHDLYFVTMRRQQ